MTENSWKALFAPHILQRGYDYYDEGRVWDIVRQDNYITALVSGMEEYHVAIRMDESGLSVSELDCDCPYAEDGNHCKHEAAVLYELSEEFAEEPDTEIKSPLYDLLEESKAERIELREIINRMPEDAVREMLFDLALWDRALENKILATYRESIDQRQIQKMKETVTDIQYAYSDRSGFVNWRNASDYINALESFLYDNVLPLIDRNLLEEAFELTCHVFLTIGNTDIDDDGDVSNGARSCFDLWERIAEKASDEYQKTMYWWFESHIGNESVIDYMEDYLKDFLLSGFHSKELLQVRLEDLDLLIRSYESRIRNRPDLRFRMYWLEKHVLNRIRTMEELELPREEVAAFYQKYDYLPRVLLAHAEEYRDKGDFTKAVDLLESGKRRDTEDKSTVADYSKRLIEIYRDSGDRQKLVRELLFQITTCWQSSLHYVDELKQAVEKESWPVLREQILSADTCSGIRTELFASEKMLPELMEEIVRERNIYTLEKYEKILRPQYSAQIRNMYEVRVREMAELVSNRKEYRRLVKELKKLTRYEGGREIARDIAAEWKGTYSRRPALMDELQKGGF